MLAGGRGSGDGSNDIGCLDAVVNTLLIAKHLARCPGSKVTRHGISSGFWLKSGCLFVLSLSLTYSALPRLLPTNYFLPIHCLHRNWVDCLRDAAFFALSLQMMMMMAMADDERFARACRSWSWRWRWRRSFCHCFSSCACNFLHCAPCTRTTPSHCCRACCNTLWISFKAGMLFRQSLKLCNNYGLAV